MAKGKRKRKRPGHSSASTVDSAESILVELEAKLHEIAVSEPQQAGPIWGAVHKLLLKTAAEPSQVLSIIAGRDIDALRTCMNNLSGEPGGPGEPGESTEDEPDENEDRPAATSDIPRDIPPDTLKKAMRAFRKRIKLIRLDHESHLGYGPMTSGRKADFDAIMPPRKYAKEVWELLVESGQLRRAGPGFYMLAQDDSGS